MEENKLLEKLWSEAESVEVPPELDPEKIRMRIGKEMINTGKTGQKGKHVKHTAKKKQLSRRIYSSRVAAAVIVLVASLGAYGVADSQNMISEREEMQISDQAADQSAVGNDVMDEQDGTESGVDTSDAGDVEEVRYLGDYHRADSYEEVVEMLNTLADARNYFLTADGVYDTYGIAKEEAGSALVSEKDFEDSMQGSTAIKQDQQMVENKDFSTTNLQVTGVDESDIIKTDGHYIYIATADQVQIVDVSTDTPRQLGSITPELSGNMDRILEMYVSDDRLILIVQTEDTEGFVPADSDISTKENVMIDLAYMPSAVHTQVLTYDITDPAGAKLIGTFTQDGSYHTSRKIDDRLYLFTDYGYPMINLYYRRYTGGDEMQEKQPVEEETELSQEETEISQADVKSNLPKVQGVTIPENCIFLPKEAAESGVLISSMNVKEPEKAIDHKLIFSGYSSMYVTKDTILIYCSDYDMSSDTNRTKLTKFAIRDGRITADCAEAVPGQLEDTFAIHENRDGYLYVLTTSYTENGNTNQIYVLDDKLKIHGKIEHIADGETVYAARFVDEIGYFVTYRNMDPLFTVDFSNPANPTLIGELEIPGFSDYLQFWDDTHLIGVGEERKEGDSEFVGIKLSLYDISDPAHVKENAKCVMDDACYAPAQYNYRALLADSGKNLIAFLTSDKGENNRISQRIFTVQDGLLKKAATDKITGSDVSGENDDLYAAPDEFRNLYIGDKLYLVREGVVIVYDITKDFERIATCKLK